jgi:dynein heavy chain, axonemal
MLPGTDDIVAMLEDMGMNIGSMLSSKYVRPLLDEVRRWETRLGLIGEVVAAWMNVQRKWMYLESIFASEDIRHQLAHVIFLFWT